MRYRVERVWYVEATDPTDAIRASKPSNYDELNVTLSLYPTVVINNLPCGECGDAPEDPLAEPESNAEGTKTPHVHPSDPTVTFDGRIDLRAPVDWKEESSNFYAEDEPVDHVGRIFEEGERSYTVDPHEDHGDWAQYAKELVEGIRATWEEQDRA